MHKILFDNNLSHRLLNKIQDLFPHSSHVMMLNLDESSDLEVWQYAKQNNFTIATKDSDFNDLAIYKGTPPKIIWLKIGNCKIVELENIFIKNETIIKNFLDDNHSAILEI